MIKTLTVTLSLALSACITYAPTDVDIRINQPATAQGSPQRAPWLAPRKAGETHLTSVALPTGDVSMILGAEVDAEPASGSNWLVVATLLEALGADEATRAECLARRLDIVPQASFTGAPTLAGLHWADDLGHLAYIYAGPDRGGHWARGRVLEHELAHMVAACMGLKGHPPELYGDNGALVAHYGALHAGLGY